MNKLKKGLDHILNVMTGASFLAMVALTFWQVVARYVLKSPSTWSEELVSYLFAWASLLGACLVTGERGHMNIPILVDRFTAPVQKIFAIGTEVIAFLFSTIILVFGGVQIASLAMGQLTSSLGVAVGFFYIILPLSGVLNAIYAILNICEIVKDGVPKSAEEIETPETGKGE